MTSAPSPARPPSFEDLHAAASSLHRDGRPAEALAMLEPLLQATPPLEASALAALCLRRLNRLPEAEIHLRQVLAQAPGHAGALHALGRLLFDLGRFAEAETAHRQLLALQPAHPQAHEDLGNALFHLGRFAQAEEAYRHALAVHPDDANIHFNLGVLLHQTKRLPEAEAAYRRALALAPNMVDALHNLGLMLKSAGMFEEGIGHYRRAVACSPHDAVLHGDLAYTTAFLDEDGQAALDECRHWSARFEAPLRAARQPHANERTPQRRLRIGYVSPDFRTHCQTLFTVPVFSRHDHTAFEFFFYSSVAVPDAQTQRLKGCADVWRDVCALDDEQLAQVIREDGIDILVDLAMHMSNGRPLLFARKPAPVQIAWLAYPGTTGVEAIDYRLTDPHLDPPANDALYTERSIRLPETFWCYDPLADQPAVSPLPALVDGRIRFGSLNNPCKLTDHTFRLWAGVLRQLPDARFAVLSSWDPPHARLLQRMQAQGIDLQQIDFLPYQPRASYLRLYQSIDICLDTFPCNGHTTSLDAFWMGVPVVTRVGQTPMGRAGLSQLLNLGLGELAAFTDAAFIDTAVQLAQDLPRLSALRQGLRQRMERSPLMDGARFARHLEAVYRKVWQDWCQGA